MKHTFPLRITAFMFAIVLFAGGFPVQSARASSSCAAVFAESTKDLALLIQYRQTVDRSTRNSLWKKIINSSYKLQNDDDASSNCDRRTVERTRLTSGIYTLFAMSNGSSSAESYRLDLARSQIESAFSTTVTNAGQDDAKLNYNFDLQSYSDIRGFDEAFLKSVARRLITLYSQSHVAIERNVPSDEDFWKYWAGFSF